MYLYNISTFRGRGKSIPIIAPKRNGSGPNIACQMSLNCNRRLRNVRKRRRRTLTPARTEKARSKEPNSASTDTRRTDQLTHATLHGEDQRPLGVPREEPFLVLISPYQILARSRYLGEQTVALACLICRES